jgi:nicotinamidase-related amidase
MRPSLSIERSGLTPWDDAAMKQTYGIAIPTDLTDLCRRHNTALLVYDMQVGIRSQVAGADQIVERCAAALSAARQAGMRVVCTRHQSCPKSWMGATQYRTAMAWQRTDDPQAVKPWFPRGAPSAEIVPELTPTAHELVLDKLSMSAFEGTPLAFALRDCGVVGVAIVGIALEIGIEPTVRHATDLGFVPIVLADGCGFGNAEAAARSLASMRFIGEAAISDVDTFARLVARQ